MSLKERVAGRGWGGLGANPQGKVILVLAFKAGLVRQRDGDVLIRG